MKLTYHQSGDYLLPNIKITPCAKSYGKYGSLRKSYLKGNKNAFYQSLLLTEQLHSHLLEIDHAAYQRLSWFLETAKRSPECPDKAEHQLEWIAYMNQAKVQAEEIIYNELIYI